MGEGYPNMHGTGADDSGYTSLATLKCVQTPRHWQEST